MPIFDFGEKRSGNTPVFDFGECCEQGIGDDGGEAEGGPICASNSSFRPQVIRTFMFFCSLSRLRKVGRLDDGRPTTDKHGYMSAQ
jgi:hypothetical protein